MGFKSVLLGNNFPENQIMDECKNRAKGSLEWKDGEFDREKLDKWYTNFLTTSQRAPTLIDTYQVRQPEIDALNAEVAHWKANHDNMVNRSRVLIDRPDLPLERVKAFEQLETLKAENEKLRKAAEEAHALLVEIDKQVTLTESACEVMDDLRAALDKGKSC
jgi:uncharacterized coiled-coil DUF342 family protein